MALEALKAYAAEQNQATRAEIDKLLKNDALKRPTSDEKGEGEYKTPIEVKKPLEALTEGLEGINKLQREADRKKQDIDRSLAICREYQQNIKTSSQLQTEILKGVRAGEDIYSLFLKAVKAISLMTSNTVFYSQLEGDIRAIYGQGLLDPLPLQIELQQVQERLKRLREAEERELEADSRERIKRAVTAHENRIAELEALIAKGAESKASKQGEARL